VGRFVKGDVVVLPFPFSDLSNSKKRPAFVITNLQGDDLILCQITSQQHNDSDSISLISQDFINGNLNKPSYIRPNRIFTADERIISKKVGNVQSTKISEVITKLIQIVQR